jgi:hypothetical protein
MQWLDPMDAWVACKCRLVYDTKFDGLTFELINMQALYNTLLLYVKQVKKYVQKDAKLFNICVHGPINESVDENGINEMLGNSFLKKCVDVFPINLHGLPLGENILG